MDMYCCSGGICGPIFPIQPLGALLIGIPHRRSGTASFKIRYVLLLQLRQRGRQEEWFVLTCAIAPPFCQAYAVILGEIFIDLVKHSFILKFNNIPATVYQKFSVSPPSHCVVLVLLCLDSPAPDVNLQAIIAEDATLHRLGSQTVKKSNPQSGAEAAVDPTHNVTQRLGLPAFALVTVVIRVLLRVFRQVHFGRCVALGFAQVANTFTRVLQNRSKMRALSTTRVLWS